MFEKLDACAGNADLLFAELARQLVSAGRFHELFEARLAQSRYRLGLAVDSRSTLDELPEPLQSRLEEAYVEACRQVGQLLVEARRFREAWLYLRSAGEKKLLRVALERVLPNDDTIEELVQVAFHEGVAPQRGLGWMLGHYGTCNSVTAFEGLAPHLNQEDQRGCAAVLVRHLHAELLRNVRAHIEQHEGQTIADASLAELVADRDWLFADDNYHIDTSHLAAVVRFARLLEAPEAVRLALDLAEYGRRLGSQLQYPGDPPFEDLYASHRLLFLATLGHDVDTAIDYFRGQAEQASQSAEATAPVETFLILLTRVGQYDKALAAYEQFVPADTYLSPYAPSLLSIADRSGNWEHYLQIVRDRGDSVGYALGQLQMAAS